MPARPSRRTVVSAAIAAPACLVAATATGCTLSGPPPRPSSAPRTPQADPDVLLLDRVNASTQALVGLYEGVLDRHRGLRRELRPLLAAHREHATALGEAAPGTGGAGQRRRASTSPAPDVPAGRRAAVRALRTAERDASAERLESSLEAESGSFARLLASMSACSAQHDQVLTGIGAR